jgi:hypothetical protein
MHAYHKHLGLVGSNVSQVVQPTGTRAAPTGRETLRPTRFNVPQPTLHGTTPSPQGSSVESEYRKYTSGEVSPEATEILWFWEVRFFYLNDINTMT